MILDVVQAVGVAAIVFFLLLGGLYLLDPEISSKVWLGVIFVMIGITILLVLISLWDLGIVVIGAIAGLLTRPLLDKMGIGQ